MTITSSTTISSSTPMHACAARGANLADRVYSQLVNGLQSVKNAAAGAFNTLHEGLAGLNAPDLVTRPTTEAAKTVNGTLARLNTPNAAAGPKNANVFCSDDKQKLLEDAKRKEAEEKAKEAKEKAEQEAKALKETLEKIYLA